MRTLGIGMGLNAQRSGFSPLGLFSGGQAGDVWLNSAAYYFTDTAGTVPVTTTGDLVAAWRGAAKGTLFVQGTSGSRPSYESAGGIDYLSFDGSNNFLSTSAINFTGTDAVSAFVGVRKLSDAGQTMLLEFGIGADSGRFDLQAPPSATAGYSAGSRGSVAASAVKATGFAAPISNVVSLIADISDDSLALWVNDTQEAASAADQGTGNYGNYALSIGARSNGLLPLTGWVGPVIVRGGAITAGQAASTRRWCAGRFGVTF